VRVYTDHGAALGISRQSTLETTSAKRSNLRLVRTSEYIQRFDISVCYKPGKTNIVPDALSRLKSATKAEEDAELDFGSGYISIAYNFIATMAEMSPKFKERLIQGYTIDPAFQRIIDDIKENEKLEDNKALIPFSLDNDLLWHYDEVDRLCIPESLVGEVLKIAHTEAGHLGSDRTYERAATSWYIRSLARYIRDFIRHCPQCKVYQTRRHTPYGLLQPVQAPPMPFHTITIDFILALPEARDSGFDIVLSITDKFSKRITLVPSLKTFSAAQWADALLQRLWIAD
jgi:hypothetical protein